MLGVACAYSRDISTYFGNLGTLFSLFGAPLAAWSALSKSGIFRAKMQSWLQMSESYKRNPSIVQRKAFYIRKIRLIAFVLLFISVARLLFGTIIVIFSGLTAKDPLVHLSYLIVDIILTVAVIMLLFFK